MSMPVIRLKIEQMEHTVAVALTDYEAQLDSEIQEAVKRACKPENVQRVIDATVYQEVNRALEASVKSFFGYGGKGAEIINRMVQQKLTEEVAGMVVE